MILTPERRKYIIQYLNEEILKFERISNDLTFPALHPYIMGLLFHHAREIGLTPWPNFRYGLIDRIDMVWYNSQTKSMEAAFEIGKAINPISIKKLLGVDATHKYLISCGECKSWRFRSATKTLRKQSNIKHLEIYLESS